MSIPLDSIVRNYHLRIREGVMYGVAKEFLIHDQFYFGASKCSCVAQWNGDGEVFWGTNADGDSVEIQYYNTTIPENDSFRPVIVVGNVYASYKQLLMLLEKCCGDNPVTPLSVVQIAINLAGKTIEKYGIAPYYTIGSQGSLTIEWYVIPDWRLMLGINKGVMNAVVRQDRDILFDNISGQEVIKLIGNLLKDNKATIE